jgi:hypothetical protein
MRRFRLLHPAGALVPLASIWDGFAVRATFAGVGHPDRRFRDWHRDLGECALHPVHWSVQSLARSEVLLGDAGRSPSLSAACS